MSATITLKNTMARSTGAALNLIQHNLVIAFILLMIGIINFFSGSTPSDDQLRVASPAFSVPGTASDISEEGASESAAATLSPRMQGALDYVKRRYHVSADALEPVFEVAQLIGKERRIDPLLIVAIIGVESGFNPFAESRFGAQGLMQIIPRFHTDKLPDGAGYSSLLDPIINIRVGVNVLEEAIRRRGGLIAGLQYYAGSSDAEGNYASKVLAEKARLEQAVRRNATPSA